MNGRKHIRNRVESQQAKPGPIQRALLPSLLRWWLFTPNISRVSSVSSPHVLRHRQPVRASAQPLANGSGNRATTFCHDCVFVVILQIVRPSSTFHNHLPPNISFLAMSGQQVRAKLKRAGKSTGKCLKKAAWQACKVCLVVSCAPCICVAVLHNQLRRRRRNCNLGVSFEHARPPVPYPRERALTIPSTEWQEDQKTLDQPQSLFMTKLPLEVRRLVYEHAVGKQSIHLWNLGGNLRANPCRLGECRCGNNDSPMEKQLGFALPLLRTCRLM